MTKKNARAEALAERIAQGAAELAAFAEGLSESEWRKPCNDRDRRTLGVLVLGAVLYSPFDRGRNH